MIVVQDIIKRFGRPPNVFTVLNGLNATFPAGCLNYLVGPSGCGKTTLISIIGAMLKPDAGTVDIFGKRITAMSEREMSRFRAENIGFTFQQFNLIRQLSVRDNVAAALIPIGVPNREAKRRAEAALERFGLEARADESPGALSGGEQQRVALARAMVKRPSILICDEPTAALDRVTGRAVLEDIYALSRQSDMVVLVVTHDNRIFDLADNIASMEDGKIGSVAHNG